MEYILRRQDSERFYYLKNEEWWAAGSVDARIFPTEASAKRHLRKLGLASPRYRVIKRELIDF